MFCCSVCPELLRLKAMIAIGNPSTNESDKSKSANSSRLPKVSRSPCRIRHGFVNSAKCSPLYFSFKAWRMEGKLQTRHRSHLIQFRQVTRHAPSHRLTANHKLVGINLFDNLLVSFKQLRAHQDLLPIIFSSLYHIREIETNNSYSFNANLYYRLHELMIHAGTAPCAKTKVTVLSSPSIIRLLIE